MKIRLALTIVALAMSSGLQAVSPDKKTLPRGLAPHEYGRVLPEAPMTEPPQGKIRSLAEWEASDGVMTLWTNPSWIKAIASRGPVWLLADGRQDQGWWENWLRSNGIPDANVRYFHVRTDSIWVRDYGPWFILDGAGRFGIVDTTYNRPRPNDDRVPQFLARELGLPLFQPGLVHTGGNYYNDGLDSAFSSTLVYTENPRLSKPDIDGRMRSFLGIERYTTSPLAPKITIEHLDTFGKPVTADTWVFSEFPPGSRYRKDSENYVALLKTLKSPYGTPYRILRLPMRVRPGRPEAADAPEDYRASLNSFISNRALYYPVYGDSTDEEVRKIYQQALPGYEIVGVNSGGTSWGDSVHCRSRNLLRRQTLFLFPRVESDATGKVLTVDAWPTPGSEIDGVPEAHVLTADGVETVVPMEKASERRYTLTLPGSGPLRVWIRAKDTAGTEKVSPAGAPHVTIEIDEET